MTSGIMSNDIDALFLNIDFFDAILLDVSNENAEEYMDFAKKVREIGIDLPIIAIIPFPTRFSDDPRCNITLTIARSPQAILAALNSLTS